MHECMSVVQSKFSTPLPIKNKTNVTGFAKMGLPHVSNLPTLTISNIRLKTAIPLKLDSSEWQHRLIDAGNFMFAYALKPKLQSSNFIELGVYGRLLFANPVTNNNKHVFCQHHSMQLQKKWNIIWNLNCHH